MFGLFKKNKTPAFTVTDKIWISSDAKFRAMRALVNSDPLVVFVHWFDESLERSKSYFGAEPETTFLYTAREISHSPVSGKRIIFAEHHPLVEKEVEMSERLKLSKMETWSALDEPLLKKFGGEKLVGLMQKLGMAADEMIEHPLISKSIRKAQEKIAKKISIEQTASGQEEWFRRNLG